MNIFRSTYSRKQITNVKGFTLVELMIALFISGLVMASVATIYITQSRNYSALDDIANIQQGIRGALIILPLEMRLAGCDPEEENVAGILVATSTQFRFTHDTSGDAINADSGDGDVDDPNEDITYSLATGNDTDNNGIVDNNVADWDSTGSLARDTNNGGGLQPMADNIEALEFNYILNDGTSTLTPANLARIREVQVSLLTRATNPVSNHVNTKTYTTASGVVWDPPDDNFRRRLVVTNIQLRNMGY